MPKRYMEPLRTKPQGDLEHRDRKYLLKKHRLAYRRFLVGTWSCRRMEREPVYSKEEISRQLIGEIPERWTDVWISVSAKDL
jgi:hypothetical protein